MDSIIVPIYKNRLVKLTRGTRIQGTNDKCGKIIRLTTEKACISWDVPNKAGVRLAYLFYSGIKCGLPTIQSDGALRSVLPAILICSSSLLRPVEVSSTAQGSCFA
jgi:hypothetical protein